MPAVRRSFFTANQPSFSFARMQWARSMDRPDADPLRAFARNKLQQKLAEELCFVACERVDHKAAPVVVGLADNGGCFLRIKILGFHRERSFFLSIAFCTAGMHGSPRHFCFCRKLRRGLCPGSLRRFGREGRVCCVFRRGRPASRQPGFRGGGALRYPPACIRRIRPCNTGMHPRYTVPLR